jgi:hypothetical protein
MSKYRDFEATTIREYHEWIQMRWLNERDTSDVGRTRATRRKHEAGEPIGQNGDSPEWHLDKLFFTLIVILIVIVIYCPV